MFDLKKLLEGAIAQINPFDGGKDFASVQRGQSRPAPQPASTARPRVNQGQPQQSQGAQRLQQGMRRVQQPALPEFNPGAFFDDIRKNVENVTKPISKGGANPFADAGEWTEKNIVKPTVETVTRAGNTLALPVAAGVAAANGTNKDQKVQQQLNEMMKNSFITPEVASGKANPLEFAKQFTNRGVEVAGLLPIGTGAAAGIKAGKPTIDMLKSAAVSNAKQAGVLGTATTANDVMQGRGVTAQSLAGNYVAPAVLGTGSQVVGSLAKPAVRAAADAPVRAQNYGLKPPTNLSEPELNAAMRMTQSRAGYISPQDVTPNEAALYRQAEAKLGAQPGTPQGDTAVRDALNAHRGFDQQRQQRADNVVQGIKSANDFVRTRLVPGGTLDANLGKLPEKVPQVDELAQVAPVQPRIRTKLVQTQQQPQVPALRPQQTVLPDNGGDILPPQAGMLDLPNPTKETRYASRTIPQSEFVGDSVSAQTKQNAPQYIPETERGRYEQTLRNADQQGFDNFENDVLKRLESENINSQTVADSQAVAQRLEAKGDDVSLRRAAKIYDDLSAHLTKAGQTVQAAAIMSRRSPEGMKFQALRDLRNADVQIGTAEIRKIDELTKNIAKTEPGTDARKIAVAELAKEVDAQIPNGAISNLVSVWKAGLLSGVKTTQGNIISNATFGLLNRASNPATLLADNIIGGFTNKRAVTGTLRGSASGAKEGLEKGLYTAKTGIDLRDVTDKYEGHKGINFENKTVQKFLGNPAQKVFDFMSAQDQPFYFSQLKNSMYDLAKAEGINSGLRGKALREYMEKTVENPPESLLQRATDEASKAVLGYDTVAYKAIQGAKRGIKNSDFPPKVRDAAGAVIDVLAPFTRVPTAFLSRSVDYTPLGIGKETFNQIANGKFDQRALSKAIGEGVTGTGVIAMGVALSKSGQLSGDYPTDPKEQQRWKSQNIQPNSVKIGDTWVSLNYLGPLGMLFGAGKKFEDAAKDGADALTSASAAIGGFSQTLLGQSFLQGLSGFMDAAKDPKRYMESLVESQAGSIVPALVNDFANLTDGYKREIDGPLEAILNRIPGARQNLKQKQDVYGNKLEQNAASALVGVKPNVETTNDVTAEVSRLANIDQNDKDLQVTPTPVDKSIKVGDQQVKLTNDQRYQLQEKIGQATQKAWGDLIKTDKYKSLTDAEKAKSLSNLRQDITAIQQREYVAQNNLGTYDKNLSKAQQKLQDGRTDTASYAKTSDEKSNATTDYNSSNDAEYKDMRAKYEEKVKNNEYSPAQKIKAETALNKAKVGAQFSKATRDYYGLTKAQLNNLVTTDPNGKKILEEVLAYGDALKEAGINSYNKFRNSRTGEVSLVTAKKGGGRKKSGGGKRGGGRGKSYDYAGSLRSLNSLGNNNQKALRSLVKGTGKYTRKKINGGKIS